MEKKRSKFIKQINFTDKFMLCKRKQYLISSDKFLK